MLQECISLKTYSGLKKKCYLVNRAISDIFDNFLKRTIYFGHLCRSPEFNIRSNLNNSLILKFVSVNGKIEILSYIIFLLHNFRILFK